MRVTLSAVNKALAQEGIKAELVRGEGYFYFVGDDVDLSEEQGVYGVYRLSELSVERWLQEAKDKMVKQ